MTEDDALVRVIKCLGGQWQNRKKIERIFLKTAVLNVTV